MYVCYLCPRQFPHTKGLTVHLNFSHSAMFKNKIVCKQDNCISEFQNMYSFKKHLNRKHPPKSEKNLVSRSSNDIHESCTESGISLRFPEKLNSAIETNLQNQTDICSSERSLKDDIHKISSAYVAKLYNENTVPRSHVQNVIESTKEFLCSEIDVLKSNVMGILRTPNVSLNIRNNVDSVFSVSENVFEGLETEYQRFKFFRDTKYLIEPKRYELGQNFEIKRLNGVEKLMAVPVTGEFISIKETLKLILDIDENFNLIQTYVEECLNLMSSPIYSNIMQSSLWKAMLKNFVGKSVLPIFLYYDDFETNNPLGSHVGVHKMGTVYFSLPFIPEQFQSCLNNIFLTLIFHTKDRVSFGNKNTFKPLIDELKLLENKGILLESGKIVQISCVLILGDNLAMHEILGFVQSFSANVCCRFCTAPKSLITKQTVECLDFLRSKSNYDNLVSQANIYLTGIKESCIWNELSSFHVSENLSCDIMHDLFEGVCHYDLSKILLQCINSKLFTLEDLNCRLEGFDFGIVDTGNRPPLLLKEKLKNGKLGYSATETICFLKYLGLLIGDLIPSVYEPWELYKTLCQIVDIVTLRSFKNEHIQFLQVLIAEHHELYLELFHEPLKPKHHFMVHYPRIMLLVGPLVKIWCMRYEGKHKQFKMAAQNTNSRINLPYTLAIKHQLQFFSEFFSEPIIIKSKINIGPVVKDVIKYDDIASLFLNEMILPKVFEGHCFPVSWIRFQGILFKSGMVLFVGIKGFDPVFVLIKDIVIENANSNKNILLFIQEIETIGLNSHLTAFEVRIMLRKKWLSLEEIECKFTFCLNKAANGKTYIISNYGQLPT